MLDFRRSSIRIYSREISICLNQTREEASKMDFLQTSSCCFCADLKTGGIIIGIVGLVSSASDAFVGKWLRCGMFVLIKRLRIKLEWLPKLTRPSIESNSSDHFIGVLKFANRYFQCKFEFNQCHEFLQHSNFATTFPFFSRFKLINRNNRCAYCRLWS